MFGIVQYYSFSPIITAKSVYSLWRGISELSPAKSIEDKYSVGICVPPSAMIWRVISERNRAGLTYNFVNMAFEHYRFTKFTKFLQK